MRKSLAVHDLDWLLLALAVLIAAIGVVEIYGTTAHTALASQYKRQIFWVAMGVIVALVLSQFDYHLILEHSPWLFALCVIALIGLLLGGRSIAGTRRWLHLGGLTFQVSELAKMVIILVVAAHFAERKGNSTAWRDLAKLGALVGVPAVLVALEPDLGTALTFFPIVAVGIFMGGIRARHVVALGLLFALVLPLGWHHLRPYQRERVLTFLNPSQDTQGSSYQVTQTRIAIGSGGFWGKGIGNGTQSRLGFIPVSHADSIFAAFAEEKGFVGTLFVLLLYFALLLRLTDGAQMARDRAGAFLVIGIASVLFFQVVVNIGMLIGYFPIAGIPLPLMSQGGSSVLLTFAGLGLAMSVKMRRILN
jgi:rod shape determining protein RodA